LVALLILALANFGKTPRDGSTNTNKINITKKLQPTNLLIRRAVDFWRL
jgi:hypothetical protein